MARSHQFICILLFLFASVKSGLCLRCLVCGVELKGDGTCKDQTHSMFPIRDCNSDQVCARHWTTGGKVGDLALPDLEWKVCATPNYCVRGVNILEHQFGLKTTRCSICITDLCNSGTQAFPTLIIFTLPIIKYYLL